MDEMDMLLTESRSLASDILTSIEQAQDLDTTDDMKEAVHSALSSGEEMRDRLEEALDFVSSDDEEVRIEAALVHLEDALDSCHLAITSDDPALYLDEIRTKVEESIFDMAPVEEIEAE